MSDKSNQIGQIAEPKVGRLSGWPLAGLHMRLLLLAGIIAASSATLVRANEFSQLVVFGDSETDAGNVYSFLDDLYPPAPPYFPGHFSNGPVWVDLLADSLGLSRAEPSFEGGVNYAWGGATTGSIDNFFGPPLANVDEQVDQYLTSMSPVGDELFVVHGGVNDFFQGQTDPYAPVMYLTNQISLLAEEGAQKFLVANLNSFTTEGYRAWAESFNTSLAEEVLKLQLAYDDISIGELDIFGVEETILADPGSFGFTNVVDPACADCEIFEFNPTDYVDDADPYFVWDPLGHRTERVHQFLGAAAFDALPAERVRLDIKPGSDPNSVNLKSKGVLPIAILSTQDFDARDLDVDTLRFGDSLLVREGATAAIPLRSAEEDVNGDGLKDLTLKLSMRDLVGQGALGPQSFAGSLTGATLDGSEIVGFDRIRIVGQGAKGVPEPSTFVIAIIGLVGLALMKRRNR